jgi:hypothetical protein
MHSYSTMADQPMLETFDADRLLRLQNVLPVLNRSQLALTPTEELNESVCVTTDGYMV